MTLTAEQHALRKKGITGSEIAAIAGLSAHSNATDVWERKLGLVHEDLSDNPHIIRGTLFEAPVLTWYARITRREVEAQGTLVHPKYPLIMATPDGISRAPGTEDRVVEVKCPTWMTARHWGTPGTDEVPVYHLPQLTFEMAVSGLKQADAVLFAGVEPHVYPVSYDQEFFEALHEMAAQFWTDHVLTRIPPPPDASLRYADFIARYAPQFERPTEVDLTDNPEAVSAAKELKETEETLDILSERRELCRNRLKALMGGHTHARVPGGKIIWKQSKPIARTQYKELMKAASIPAELIEKHTKTGEPARPFRINWDR